MARRPFTLRSTHLLMWSSPLLLLVLVFTLTARPLHVSPTSTTTPSTTERSLTTTTQDSTTTTRNHNQNSATTSTSTSTSTTTSTMNPTPAMTLTSGVPLAHSYGVTTTSVAAIVTLGALTARGELTLASPTVVLPLRGPGQWALESSHAVTTSLQCGAQSVVVVALVRIVRSQVCLLDIAVKREAPITWTLHAAR